MRNVSRFTGLVAVIASASLMACDAAVDVGLDARADVSFQVPDGAGGVLGGSEAPNEVRSGGHVLTVTQATVTASALALRGTSRSTHESDVTFDLPVRGGIVTPVRMAVESGTFTELEVRLRSVRLRGEYDGEPFDVTVRTDAAAALRLFPPVSIESGEQSNVTVRVELMEWFRAETGGLIEPARLELDGSLQAMLRANVESSLRAFLDLNADGNAG